MNMVDHCASWYYDHVSRLDEGLIILSSFNTTLVILVVIRQFIQLDKYFISLTNKLEKNSYETLNTV